MKEESGYILGIETSTRTFSLAVTKGKEIISLTAGKAGRRLDSLLIPGIQSVLDSAGIKARGLAGIAASTGPGYFTGIRVGLAAAKGLAYALGKPAAGVLSLDSIAENSAPAGGGVICAAISAGRGNVYYRLYRYNADAGVREPLAPPSLSAIDALAGMLEEKTAVLCEDESVSGRIKDAAGDNAVIMPPEFGAPSASMTAALGFRRLAGGEPAGRSLLPVYLKKPDAEENFRDRHPEIEIRPAAPGDMPGIMRIERASFPTPWSELMFEAEFIKDSGVFITAKCENSLIGYACGWYAADEFHLANLAVAPEFRGRGGGKKLLQKIIACVKSKNISCVILEVRHRNMPAISLYEKFGFRPVAKRKRYYGDTDEDAVLMELRL